MTEKKAEELPEWMTDPKPNLATRLRRIMSEPTCRYLQKEAEAGSGNDSFGYTYVPHGQVSSVIQPLLARHGVLMLTSITETAYDVFGSGQSAKLHTQVKMTISFVNTDDPKDRFDIPWESNAIHKGDKGLFAAISSGIRLFTMKQTQAASGDMDIESFNESVVTTPVQTIREVAPESETAEPPDDYKTAIGKLMNRWKAPKGKDARRIIMFDLAEELSIPYPTAEGDEWDRASLRQIHDYLDDQVRRGFGYTEK